MLAVKIHILIYSHKFFTLYHCLHNRAAATEENENEANGESRERTYSSGDPAKPRIPSVDGPVMMKEETMVSLPFRSDVSHSVQSLPGSLEDGYVKQLRLKITKVSKPLDFICYVIESVYVAGSR